MKDSATLRLLAPGGVIDARVAVSSIQRMRGLIGAPPLPAGRGLLIRARHVHTALMSFPIDVVYFDRRGVVLRVATLEPWRIGPLVARARWVLEVAEGEARRLGLEVGTKVPLPPPMP